MRPTRLTPEVADTIVQAIEEGLPLRAAAGVAGIGERTFFEWLARGEGTSPRPRRDIYAQFAQRVRQAEAKAHLSYVRVVREAAIDRKDADKALKFLRLRWGDEYPAERRELTGPGGTPLVPTTVTIDDDPDRLAEVLDVLRSVGALPLAGGEETPSGTRT